LTDRAAGAPVSDRIRDPAVLGARHRPRALSRLARPGEPDRGLGALVLIAEQKARQLFRIADRVYGLKIGRVVVEGTPADLDAPHLQELF
jgi:hypothetical protein